jgi:nucleoside-diphosphate-sugar epimerase
VKGSHIVKVLVVGGSGGVGTSVIPYLQRAGHQIRVLDVNPPAHDVEFVKGSISSLDDVKAALQGVDTFIVMVMRNPQGGHSSAQTLEDIVNNYEVNALGLHLFLYCAQEAGIKRGIYTSTMSVHYRYREWFNSEEAVPLDSPSVYGLTKGFGEEICEYFARWFDMNLLAFRITAPRSEDEWLEERRAPIVYSHVRESGNHRAPDSGRSEEHVTLFVTHPADLADAYARGLEVVQRGNARFDAIFIAGDEDGLEHNLTKAQRVLGWQPRRYTPDAD